MPRKAEHFGIYGHRGSPRRAPENTIESFDQALREGADGFETDLRLLADGTAVLYHDAKVGRRRVESLTCADFARRELPLQPLRDLARYAGRTQMILEVKRGGWEEALIAEVGRWPRIVVASFDHDLIASLADRRVRFPLGVTLSRAIRDLPRYVARFGATWCFPDHRRIDAAGVRALRDSGITVVPWTADRRSDWKRLRAIGCHGVITNNPAGAVAWRTQHR